MPSALPPLPSHSAFITPTPLLSSIHVSSVEKLHPGQPSLQYKILRPIARAQPLEQFSSPPRPNIPTMTLPNINLQAIFFDLDGTCLNSDHIHFETYRETLLELVPTFNDGIPITRRLYDTEMAGRQNPELVASFFPKLPLSERTTIWQTKESRYENVIARGIPPIPGLPKLLTFCNSKNLLSYVVTNSPRGSAAKTLSAIGLSAHFSDRVVLAEDCQFPKPHPAPYLRALHISEISPQNAVAFEDSPSGTRSATAAGLVTIGVTSTQTDATLKEAGALFTIPDYTAPALARALAHWLN